MVIDCARLATGYLFSVRGRIYYVRGRIGDGLGSYYFVDVWRRGVGCSDWVVCLWTCVVCTGGGGGGGGGGGSGRVGRICGDLFLTSCLRAIAFPHKSALYPLMAIVRCKTGKGLEALVV